MSFSLKSLSSLTISSCLARALRRIAEPKCVTLDFCVIGPRRVGKTTILASMYESFKSIPLFIGDSIYKITPDRKTDALLNEKARELRRIAETGDEYLLCEDSGTVDLNRFGFSYTEKEKEFLVTNFHDFPGGWVSGRATNEEIQKLNNLFQRSQVAIIAIDSPSLMEKKGKFFSKFNSTPEQLVDLFKQFYIDLKEPRLVLFVPVKCEKYIEKPHLLKDMSTKIRNLYKPILNFFADPNLKSNVECGLLPICTLGNYSFDSVEEFKGNITFKFKRNAKGIRYSPKNCDQLLIQIMIFMLRLYEKRDRYAYGLNWLKSHDGLAETAKDCFEAISRFKVKIAGGETFQGNLLELEK